MAGHDRCRLESLLDLRYGKPRGEADLLRTFTARLADYEDEEET